MIMTAAFNLDVRPRVCAEDQYSVYYQHAAGTRSVVINALHPHWHMGVSGRRQTESRCVVVLYA